MTSRPRTRCLGLLAVLTTALPASAVADTPIDFARDVRPILSDTCFRCHGPDEADRKGGLRLDLPGGMFEPTPSGGVAVVPGSLDESELHWRITSDDDLDRMPPPDSGKSLTPEQIATLNAWIEQGAPFEQHWGFIPPEQSELPSVSDPDWCRNPIDFFVRARLDAEGLEPSPEADRTTLIRRLSLDLIGLPPTPEEVDAFVNDQSPNAYEHLVNRLLASPHYGERWGRLWLDAARYADSDGYEKDKARFVWAYRDWVINALNRDLPYDQFVIEQLAGDLLPDPTQDQLVATGFLRNSMINEEGGIDPEQFRMEAMFDRMDAVGKAVLGLTISCAQCHTHKYDPISHTEYYRMFAFLNNAHESNVAVYLPEEQRQRAEIFQQITAIEDDLKHRTLDWRDRMLAWEATVRDDQPEWTVVRPELDASGGQKHYLLDDGSVLAAGYAPTKHTTDFTVKVESPGKISAVRLELLNDPELPKGGPGRSIFGLFALSEFKVVASSIDGEHGPREVKITRASADVNPPEADLDPAFDDRTDTKRVTGPIAYAIDGKNETAWTADIGPGRSNVPRKAVFVFEEPIDFPGGASLTFRLVQMHGGWNSDDNQNNNLGRFRFSVTDAPDPSADPLPARVREILAIPPDERSPAQLAAVFSIWRTFVPEWAEANEAVEALWKTHPEGATQLVLQSRDTPRMTRRLDRGDFLKPAESVTPGVPDVLHPLPEEDDSPNRLSFARWLVARESPTTARSIVNRVWQTYFGTGLVATSEDLGSQAAPPSHPELLDWLSVSFMDNGWSLKQLHRQIVTSATYRQTSSATPERYAHDPDNRLLARGPRHRVDAEIVRDIALAASGLLNPEVGGPSVFPPAPEFLFQPPASYGPKVWNTATGPDRYRRGLYTFRFRSVPYPALDAFDAPPGESSCVRRTRSNTPLQALITLNEPVFLESARALACRTLREAGETDVDRLNHAFRLCVSRAPTEAEAAVLLDLLDRQTTRYASGALDPSAMIADEAPPEGVSPATLAGWTAVARVLLNLDETITKE
ncbi:PSD1 and planctomycete cytochrome C domain-containing protein [Tautonia rosea]|uniref:PSD1 and planctomycete cytochrome C domain-containing protein n=1 Tax=Tautonia rosea TaxID=2728037 RepID=UPI0014728A9A|nr:PSD1 and planctomycete cytochrome C domain-containing protein [Tautonia rosea]